MSKEQLEQWIAEAGAAVTANPTDLTSQMTLAMSQYMISTHFLCENTLENVKRLGYLDARELYPDMPKHTLAEYAEEFYKLPEPAIFYMREPEMKLP